MEYHPRGRLRVDERQAKTLHMILRWYTDRELRMAALGITDSVTEQQEGDAKALLQELQRTMDDFGWAP